MKNLGWAAGVLLALAACGGGDEAKERGPLGEVVATTDLADRVVLSWTIDGPSPDAIGIERDGERIGTLRGSARSFEDRGASPGSLAPPELRVEEGAGSVHLEWDEPQRAGGAGHLYAVVMETAGSATGRGTATGSRGSVRPSGYEILRGEETIATVDSRTFRFDDRTASAGILGAPQGVTIEETARALVVGWSPGDPSPGPAYEYRVVAVGPGVTGARSLPVTAGRTPPVAEGFVIYRDGMPIERVSAADDTFDDDGADPGRAVVGSLAVESKVESVVLSWSPAPVPGAVHTYEVRAVVGDLEGPASAEVSGRRPAPVLEGWRLLREGKEIAELLPMERGFEDMEAEPAVVGPPRRFDATRGTRSDGVELTWESGSEVVPHLYELVALTEIGDGDPTAAIGARALPPLWYEVRRDDEPWIEVGDVFAWLDEEAPKAIVRQMEAVAVADRYRGFADMRLSAPISFEPASRPIYEVRTATASLETDAAMAPGYRGFVGLTYQWRRGFGEDVGTYVEVPEADEVSSFDLAPPLDTGVSWILELRVGKETVAWSKPSPLVMVSGYDQVSASWGFACGVRSSNKRAVCWSPGQADSAVPPRPVPPEKFQYVSAGKRHACGLAVNGAVVCWGDGSANATLPVAEYESVTSGADHACAIRVSDWKAICWGENEMQQVSAPSDTTFQLLSAGTAHTCGIRSDGKVVCWGDNSKGAAPKGPSAESFSSIAAGNDFTCGIRTGDRQVRCWGPAENRAVSRAPTSGAFDSVTAGTEHACAIRSSDKKLLCWGHNSVGQVPSQSVGGPMQMASAGNLLTCAVGRDVKRVHCWGTVSPPPSREEFTDLSAGSDLSCGIRSEDGKLYCWGSDTYERLPREPTADSFVSLSAGVGAVCAVRSGDRAVVCWGGKNGDELAPPQRPGGFASVVTGEGFACGILRDDGRAVCWGPERPPRAPATPTDEAYVELAAGHRFACGLQRADGSLACWGDETTADGFVAGPFEHVSTHASGGRVCAIRKGSGVHVCWPALGLPPIVDSLSVGANHACGLFDDGKVTCDGSNGEGQLGKPVTPGLRLRSVSAGDRFTCGIRKENGRRICWGYNWYGQAPTPDAIP